jgi:hypothetical protein
MAEAEWQWAVDLAANGALSSRPKKAESSK